MKKFLRYVWIILILGISAGSLSFPAVNGSKNEAVSAAQSWLALVDSGKYAESWDEAAQLLKSQISKDQWVNRLKSERLQLGKVESRTLKSSVSYTKSLPGNPEAEFVIVQFDTKFQRSRSFTETVTPMKEKNGQWRVSGYLIDIWQISRAEKPPGDILPSKSIAVGTNPCSRTMKERQSQVL